MPKAPSDKLLLIAGLIALAGSLLLGLACSQEAPQALAPGERLKGELAPGQMHSYRVEVEEGDYLHVVVDQQGVDVKATLLDPDGKQLIQIDRPIDDIGPEPLMAVAEMPGGYIARVWAVSGKRPIGRYEIRVEHLRLATTEDRARAAALALFSDAKAFYSEREYSQAVEGFEEAEAAWRELGERSWRAESLVRLGQAHFKLREWEKAAVHHEKAAELFQDGGNDRWEAIALQNLGVDYYSLRDLDRASANFEKALPLRRSAGDRRGQALTLQALAKIYQVRDEIQRALDTYSQTLELFERPKLRARTHHNLGVLYLSLGRQERAREALQNAERAWSEAEDRRAQATTLNQLGELHRESGDLDLALDHYRNALDLRRELKDPRGEVTSLANIGLVHQARGESDQALSFLLEAHEMVNDLRRPRLEARVLLNLGSLHLERSRLSKAMEALSGSLELYRRAEDPTGEAEALVGLARTERRRGDLAAALEDSSAALGIFESVRPRAVSLELRTSFFATVQNHFDFHIDLLMELHQLDPEAGHDTRALVASEQARARSLLDLLVESGAKIRRDADPVLLVRERELQRELNARERERFQLRSNQQPRGSKLAEVERSVSLALRELEELRSKIRARHPRYAALTQPLSLPELQREILDDETLLLEYRLGTEHSFLWALTPHSLDSFVLPRREEIEKLALKAYDRLLKSHRRETRAATRNILCDLGRILLEPVATQMVKKRLLIVADGALQFIPFAALAQPDGSEGGCRSSRPLVVDHEVSHLSSASALAIHRRQLEDRSPATRSVAILADPVFSLDDSRFTALQSSSSNTSAHNVVSTGARHLRDEADARSAEVDLRDFARLPFSHREADAIFALSGADRSFRALGFAATKESVALGLLDDYRIVHFATHGVLNSEHPDLSGIVLSQVDRKGRPQDGFLRAHEIYNLELSAELVVLSACSTALGKVVRGEGLLSLTRGFMYAGAERVMVSLWNVNDESTAELMERFYRGVLEQGLRPAAALRQAQISMSKAERRSEPYYWAGFVIEGEWK